MTKRVNISLLAALAAALMAVGCATPSSGDYDALENNSLRAWMDKNNPGWEASGDWIESDGVYIKWLKRVEESASNTIVKPENWVRINYTGKTLQEDIFYTRNAAVAKEQGTYSRRTHYVPDFVYLYEGNTLLPKGTYDALTRMKVGEMVKVVMPSGRYQGASGYNTSNVGYNGQFGLQGNVPVIIDSLTILEVSADPIATEQVSVGDFVENRWNMNRADSLAGYEGLYLQLQTPVPFARDSVAKAGKADTTLTCYYKAYFLDGFVFDTNIDSVQLRAWGEIVKSGPAEWDLTKDGDSLIEGFRTACLNACYGDHLKVAFTSAYGYGISGSAATATSSSSSSSSDFDYSDYYNYLNYYSYMNGMYGGGYGGYGSGYYNDYYSSAYYASLYSSMYNNTSSDTTSSEDAEEETKVTITTEILPFTPLVFEIWVCADDGSQKEPEHNDL